MKKKELNLKFKFRHLVLASTLTTYAVIVLGVLVRVTVGEGCPDWPACYGFWSAPLQTGALLDYLHRVISLFAGVLLLGALAWSLRLHRSERLIIVPLILAVLAFFGEVALSAASIWGLLPAALQSGLHLGLALLIFGLQLVVVAVAFQTKIPKRIRYRTPFARLSVFTFLTVFILLVSGTLVSVSSATAYCDGWPLCDPIGALGWLSLGHRVIVAVTGIFVAFLFLRAWQTQRSQPAVLVSVNATAVLFFAQTLMGAVEVSQDFPSHLMVLHTATSVAVFGTLTLTMIFSGLSDRFMKDEQRERADWLNRSAKRMAQDLLMLTKPIVVVLLLVTTFAGMVIGAQAWPSLNLTFWTLLGGFMAAGGSGAINQYIDRFDDHRMQRTQKRPIPSGRLTPAEGLAFGVAMTLGSFYILVAFVNLLAALLSLVGIIYYVLLYSIFLKKTTVQNIVIGGGAGAIPPLVGWAAATGSLNIPSLFLFAIIFMWTPPHFWALAIVRQKDYARAGVPMLPVIRGEAETRRQIFIYTSELVVLTLLIPLFGLGSSVYFILAVLLGLWLLGVAWKVWKQAGNKVAWKMYRYSSMYLAFIFAALMVDALL